MGRRRFSLSRSNRTPPYIHRSPIHRFLYQSIEIGTLDTPFILAGERRYGVTRTLEEFVRESKAIQFRHDARPSFAIIDMYDLAAEHEIFTLLALRNQIVESISRSRLAKRRLSLVDKHFSVLDKLLLLWAAYEYVEEPPQLHFAGSTGERLSRYALRRGVSVATLGAFDMLLALADSAEFLSNVPEMAQDASRTGVRSGSDRIASSVFGKVYRAMFSSLSYLSDRTERQALYRIKSPKDMNRAGLIGGSNP